MTTRTRPTVRRRALLGSVVTLALSSALLIPPAAGVPADEPAPSPGVLISEVGGAHGPGGTRDDFVELQNYGDAPVDVTGWRIYRCTGMGGRSHPVQVVIGNEILEPGERYTIARPANLSSIDPEVVDATYSTSMHPEAYGVYVQDADHGLVDRVAIYPEGTYSDCGTDDDVLRNDLVDVVGESYQRVRTEGSASEAFITALRTPGRENATQERTPVRGEVRISEIANLGPTGGVEGFIELANYGDQPADVSGWSVYQCGANGRTGATSLQARLDDGTILEAGQTLVLSARANPAVPAPDVVYDAPLHSRMAGALVLDADGRTVDRVGMYNHRDSACTDGTAAPATLEGFTSTSYQRASATGDNATDFVQALRTPGTLTEPVAVDAEPFEFSSVRISEASPAGPSGVDDEFIELANYGTEPVDLSGWSLWSCGGDGARLTTPRIADIGVVLEPGEVWTATHVNAPAALRAVAQATYVGALNQTDGYGLYLEDASADLIDSLGVYYEDAARTQWDRYSPCTKGYSAHNAYRFDEADSHARVQATGVDGEDFQLVERTPGAFNTAVWDPGTNPRDGALDPVDVPTSHRPDTPQVVSDGYTDPALTERSIVASGSDADGDLAALSVQGAAAIDLAEEAVASYGGVTTASALTAAPGTDPSETRLEGAVGHAMHDDRHGYPYQRFELDLSEHTSDLDVLWQGRTVGRNELQLYAWDASGSTWDLLDAATADDDGKVTLHASLAGYVVDGTAHVAVQDGQRTTPTFDATVEPNLAFADPGDYDVAISHISDPQMLVEYERQRYTDMFSWVVANTEGRRIAYSAITGDLVQNWLRGDQDPDRARREFQAASEILAQFDQAGLPHGVLPGNHDNMWGLDDTLYNEYFGPDRYRHQPWWGDSLTPTDNSFHYDTFEASGARFLVVHLGFTQVDDGYAWAEQVIAAHPDHNVVVASHEYFNTEGERTTRDGERWTSRGQEIYDRLVEPYENVFLVLAGHHGGVVTNSETLLRADGSERTVVEMMANYQAFQTKDGERANRYRDVAMQRLLQIDLDSQQMAVNTYSATLDLFNAWSVDSYPWRGDNARYTDADDEFIADVSIMYPKLVETTALAVTEPLEDLTVRVDPAGGGSLTATAELSGVDQGVTYAWFAESVDSSGDSTRGPLVTFIGGLECTSTITGRHDGPIRVTSGALCLDNATVRGPISVDPGASLSVLTSSIEGPVNISGAGFAHVRDTTIRGPVSVAGTSVSFVLSGGSIVGPLECRDNAASSDEGIPTQVQGPVSGECPGHP